MTIRPPVAVDAAHERGIDGRDLPADPAICPYGLAHITDSPACGEFRRAVVAKGLRAPRGGWACRGSAPSDATGPADPTVGWSG